MQVVRRWVPWLLLGISILSGLLFMAQNRDMPWFGVEQDDTIYMLSARSIALGNGYRVDQLPAHPAQTKYPPLYPAILAIIWAAHPQFPDNLLLVTAFGAICYVALVWLSYRMYRQFDFGLPTALLLTAAVAANPWVIYRSASALTEAPFTAVLLGVIVLSEASVCRSSKWAFGAGVLASCAYLLRTAALPLAVAIPLVLAVRGRRRHAVAFLAGMGPAIAGWQVWVAAHRVDATDWVTLYYTDYLGLEKATVSWANFGTIVISNLDALLMGMGDLLCFMISRTYIGHQLGQLIALAALVGVVRLCRRSNRWHLAAYALGYCPLLLAWHYPPNERFTMPLAPLFIAGLWTETRHVCELIRSSWRKPGVQARIASLGFSAALAGVFALLVWSLLEARMVYLPNAASAARQETKELQRTFAKVVRLTPADAVILSDWDGLLYLYTGRRSYRTVIPPRLLYATDRRPIRETFAAMPDSAGQAWDYALVTRLDWAHTLDLAACAEARKTVRGRNDVAVRYQDGFATLYGRRAPVTRTSLSIFAETN